MTELARHLTEDGSHAALPFHPACPACREERLAGRLAPVPVVSARTRAGLAAAVLAASASAPAGALATTPPPGVEGDQETEGSADPGAQGPVGTELPPGHLATPVTPTIEEPGSQAGPEHDDGGLEAETPTGPDPVEPEGSEEEAAVPAAPTPPAAPHAPTAVAPPAMEEPPARKGKRAPAKRAAGTRRADSPAPVPAQPAPVVVQEAAALVPAAQPVAAPAAAAPTNDAELHVVQPGESLWTIARDLLGAGATTAEIAREVQRIWDLNAHAIGTGDPDLVIAGQKLQLR